MITTTVGVEAARTGWGTLIKKVVTSDDPAGATDPEGVFITRSRGGDRFRAQAAEIVAVLVPIGWYTATPPADRPADTDVPKMNSGAVRKSLSDVLDAAERHIHTAITVYGTPRAVLVPHAWFEAKADKPQRRAARSRPDPAT